MQRHEMLIELEDGYYMQSYMFQRGLMPHVQVMRVL